MKDGLNIEETVRVSFAIPKSLASNINISPGIGGSSAKYDVVVTATTRNDAAVSLRWLADLFDAKIAQLNGEDDES